MYHAIKINVNAEHPMYTYFQDITLYSTNLYNTVLYRIRQVFTAMQKDESKWFDNEKEVIDEIKAALPKMNTGKRKNKKHTSKFVLPTPEHFYLSYNFLCALMTATENPDYYAEGFPSHAAQPVIKQAVHDMDAFYASKRKWNKDPKNMLGKPKIPHYKEKKGQSTTTFSNQACKIKDHHITFPKTALVLQAGNCIQDDWVLQEVKVVPHHNIFTVILTMDDGIHETIKTVKNPERVCAIDLGVNNFAACTNNVGLPCLLFKGGVIKSQNQWYNKEYGRMQSEQTKGTKKKFVATDESKRIGLKRENRMSDFMHKTAKHIVLWCLENNIDTIVIGVNMLWKQELKMRRHAKQSFVYIPFANFRNILQYLSERNGLNYIEQEESYTSKASFKFMDFMPVYGTEEAKYKFSGYRGPTRYNGFYNKNGFHGIYKNKDGSFVNADLNGSANIGRKCFPELFSPDNVNFNNVRIIRFPDDNSTYSRWDRVS